MPTIYTESLIRPAAYIVQEVGYYYCRDEAVLAAGAGVVLPGTVLAAKANGEMIPVAPGAADATKNAVAIALVGGDATTSALTITVTARLTEVQASRLIWPAGATDPQKTTAIAELKTLGIIAR